MAALPDEQRRERAIRTFAETIGSEWHLRILHALRDDELRFSELEERTESSPSTLSRVLGDLGDDGLVARRVEDRPIATYYQLTDRGRALAPVFDAIETWADEHLDA
ncbi:winged helix-turn-helix transcriptional regulator [Halarchaeum sp. P4]|uniref:winged helix-turn-helix transcriptional regulator n=1 Tax=Halarchaeum sp. P4 TaxID=3421639 RepID=UPI003EB9CA5C